MTNPSPSPPAASADPRHPPSPASTGCRARRPSHHVPRHPAGLARRGAREPPSARWASTAASGVIAGSNAVDGGRAANGCICCSVPGRCSLQRPHRPRRLARPVGAKPTSTSWSSRPPWVSPTLAPVAFRPSSWTPCRERVGKCLTVSCRRRRRPGMPTASSIKPRRRRRRSALPTGALTKDRGPRRRQFWPPSRPAEGAPSTGSACRSDPGARRSGRGSLRCLRWMMPSLWAPDVASSRGYPCFLTKARPSGLTRGGGCGSRRLPSATTTTSPAVWLLHHPGDAAGRAARWQLTWKSCCPKNATTCCAGSPPWPCVAKRAGPLVRSGVPRHRPPTTSPRMAGWRYPEL